MRTRLPNIHEPLEELKCRLRGERNAQRKHRLHLLVLIASNQVSTRQEAAEYLALHRNTVCRWLRGYQQRGLLGLLTVGEPGAPRRSARLTPAITEALQQHLDDPKGFSRYSEVQRWLDEEYAQPIPYSTVHRWVRYGFKTKLKRPRPQHPPKTSLKPRILPSTSERV